MQIVVLVDKEVNSLRLKIIKTIVIQVESSFLGEKGKRSTKDLITMLRSLDESQSAIRQKILLARSKFLKDFV